jgi:hypothetical protein
VTDDTTDNDVTRVLLPDTERATGEFSRKAQGIINPIDSEACDSDIREIISALKAARESIPGQATPQEREAAGRFVKLAEKYFNDLDRVRQGLLTRATHPFPAPAEYRVLVPDAPPYFTDEQMKFLMHTYKFFPFVVEGRGLGELRRGEAPEKELAVNNALLLMDRHSFDMPRFDPGRVTLGGDAAYYRFRDLAYLLFFGHIPAAGNESGILPIMREDGFSQYCRDARGERNAMERRLGASEK